MKNNYKIIAACIVILLLIIGLVYFLRNTNSTNGVISKVNRDMNTKNQAELLATLRSKNISNTKEGKLRYDVESFALPGLISNEEKLKVLTQYETQYENLAKNTKNSSSSYETDLNIFGMVYLSYKINYMTSDTSTNTKELVAKAESRMMKLSDIAAKVAAPEVLNDKVFLSARLRLNSDLYISFASKLNKDDKFKIVKRIKDDLQRIDITNYSMFSGGNAKLTMTPEISKTAANIAMAVSGDTSYISRIDVPYQNLIAANHEDKTSVNLSSITINLYRYYYYAAIANDSLVKDRAAKVSAILQDLKSNINYSADTKNHLNGVMVWHGVYGHGWNKVMNYVYMASIDNSDLKALLISVGIPEAK